MADLNPSGQVPSSEQIRAARSRKGLCMACPFEPIQCYEIKKHAWGIIRERIAMTVPGKVYNGICLDCHPSNDPDRDMTTGPRRGRRKSADPERMNRRGRGHQLQKQGPMPRMTRPLPHNIDSEGDDDGVPERANSMPQYNGRMERRLTRDLGVRDLAFSLREDNERERLSQSLPAIWQHDDEADHMQDAECYFQEEQQHQEEYQEEEEYVDEIHKNIFGEPVVVRKKKSSSPTQSDRRNNGESPHNSLPQQTRGPSTRQLPHQTSIRNGSDRSPHQQNSGPPPRQEDSGRRAPEKMPTIPDSPRESQSSNEEPMDALAQLIARHRQENPDEPVKFVPGEHTWLPNSELQFEPELDDLSVMTPDTCFQGRESFATHGTRPKSQRGNLSAISETEGGASNSHQHSMTSHRIREPATQDIESHLASSAPHLGTLREMVEMCTQAGADDGAIDVVTEALIIDNATSMSLDLATFCLTTLWVLARKNDENKRKIIFEGSTFEAIIEAMQIYREQSPQIQTKACGVLWTLSMDPNDRKHVAQGGGCEAILNAMVVYMEKDQLQVMALGALKGLSFDNIGKSMLRSRGTLSIVADIMKKHTHNPTIQSDGCVILGNLAVDEADQFVAPVSEKEVEAVVMAILAHPGSLEVHEAACFTLFSLASLAANVELIRRNSMSRVSLEMSYQNHPDVGINISNLFKLLHFELPAI